MRDVITYNNAHKNVHHAQLSVHTTNSIFHLLIPARRDRLGPEDQVFQGKMKLPAAPIGGISAPLRQAAGYSVEGE
jgi:hypothetical protein